MFNRVSRRNPLPSGYGLKVTRKHDYQMIYDVSQSSSLWIRSESHNNKYFDFIDDIVAILFPLDTV